MNVPLSTLFIRFNPLIIAQQPVLLHSTVSEKLPKNLHAWGFGHFMPFPMQVRIFQRLMTVGLVLSPVLYYNQLAFQVTVHGSIVLFHCYRPMNSNRSKEILP